MARCRGQLRGPLAQGGFGSRITLPLPFPRRHPPESRERPPQVTGWDRGVHDQRRAARGLRSRDRLTRPRAVSGSPGFGRRGPRPPASREAEERQGRNSGSQAAGEAWASHPDPAAGSPHSPREGLTTWHPHSSGLQPGIPAPSPARLLPPRPPRTRPRCQRRRPAAGPGQE